LKSKLVQIGDKVLDVKRIEPEPDQVEVCNALVQYEAQGADVPMEVKFSDSYKEIELMALRLNVEVTPSLKCLVYKLANDDNDVALLLMSAVVALAFRMKMSVVTSFMLLQNYQGHLPDPECLADLCEDKSIMTTLLNPESWSV
jgi:hypothetical protein